MGCVSSKILSKSGSFQEKVVSHGFKGSNLIEEIILSNPKRNGDQFLALLRAADDRSTPPPPAAADQFPKIETINVSDLLAGLEEEEDTDERNDGEKVFDATAARARSFRTVEEFEAMVTQSSSPERGEESRASPPPPPATPSSSASSAAAADQEATCPKPSEQEEAAVSAAAAGGGGGGGGNKRRARARQLGELKVAPAFDFSKSGSLRDWLLQGGQIFSPGSYVTPKFGAGVAATAPSPPQERGAHHAGEPQQSVFDPELVAQFEQAMERLSEEEERALEEILEAMGASPPPAAEEEEEEKEVTASDRAVMVQE